MLAISGAVICFAFILGLWATGIAADVRGIPVGAIALLASGLIAAFLVPRFWRTGPRSRIWLIAGVVGFLAALYLQWRVPQPEATDISRLLTQAESALAIEGVAVKGEIQTSPRLTQSQQIQFELQATQASAIAPHSHPNSETQTTPVTGRVYVTVPLLQGTGLYPGQIITVTGSLYKPKPAANPGGFDFEKYLAQQGIFAGLKGKTIHLADNQPSPSLRWVIRQRIIRAQVLGLGVPEGPLVSAMVMGGRAVDVPYPIRDQFRIAGLAHALAASGTQVSLLVGVILALTQHLSSAWRLGLGMSTIVLYLSLTGFEASVLRAGVMGGVALLALTAERQVKPLGSMLFAAVVLLLFNPLWIWDLGFQLSFLATLGLLVTVPVLTQWLDGLPTALTPLLAVPIAAYLWTTPLLLAVFGVVSPYSILVNILTSPLIPIISIGGMVSALAALIHPGVGSALAAVLYYPTHWFIQVAAWGSQLPGRSLAVGTIGIVQVLLLYGLIGVVWRWHRSHRYWWVAGLVGVGLVMVPAWYTSTHRVQITALATADEAVLVLQDRGKVALVNAGRESDAQFTVLPFLNQQGINHIDWAIAPDLRPSTIEGWQRILTDLPIREFYCPSESEQAVEVDTGGIDSPLDRWQNQLQAQSGTIATLSINQPMPLGAATVRLISDQPTILQLWLGEHTWLLLDDLPAVDQQPQTIAQLLPPTDVLWWTGEELNPELLNVMQPSVAISTHAIPLKTDTWLQQHTVKTIQMGQAGAVQWTPEQGFKSTSGTPG